MDTIAFQSYFYIFQAQRERSESPVSQPATCLSYLPFFVSLPLSLSVCTALSSISLAPSLAFSHYLCLSVSPFFLYLTSLSLGIFLSVYISLSLIFCSLSSLCSSAFLSLFLFLSLLYGPLHLSSSPSSFVHLILLVNVLHKSA